MKSEKGIITFVVLVSIVQIYTLVWLSYVTVVPMIRDTLLCFVRYRCQYLLESSKFKGHDTLPTTALKVHKSYPGYSYTDFCFYMILLCFFESVFSFGLSEI